MLDLISTVNCDQTHNVYSFNTDVFSLEECRCNQTLNQRSSFLQALKYKTIILFQYNNQFVCSSDPALVLMCACVSVRVVCVCESVHVHKGYRKSFPHGGCISVADIPAQSEVNVDVGFHEEREIAVSAQ